MNRRMRVGAILLSLAVVATAVAAAAAGWAWPHAVTAVACVAAAGAGLTLVHPGERVRWPAVMSRERTSAGWHEVRILADTLSAAGPDPRSRRHLVTRIGVAMGKPAPPVDAPAGATRRAYEQVLAELRQRGQ